MQIESIKEVIRYRPALVSDTSFLFDSWLKSYRRSAFASPIVGKVYYPEQQRLVGKLLGRSMVAIAANVEDPAQILGYAVFEHMHADTVFHYVYVKQPFRALGIAAKLVSMSLGGGIVFHSHSTTDGAGLVRQTGSIFNPYLAR